MSSSRSDAETRRHARSKWPIVRRPLDGSADDDLSGSTTPAERIAMMEELARTAWKLAGRPLPSYRREEMPGRLFRPGEPPPADE